MYSHKVNEILMDPGIIRHLRVKCQPDLILILGCYDVSVYFGQNNHIMSLIFMLQRKEQICSRQQSLRCLPYP